MSKVASVHFFPKYLQVYHTYVPLTAVLATKRARLLSFRKLGGVNQIGMHFRSDNVLRRL